MKDVGGINKYMRSWGYCHLNDFNDIIDIFKKECKDEIKLNEYRNYLMIITNNCNFFIERDLKIDENKLKKELNEQQHKKTNNHIIQTELKIKLDSNDTNLTYKDFFLKYNLLNTNYINVTFRLFFYNRKTSTQLSKDVSIIKSNPESNPESNFNIIDINTDTDNILNDKNLKIVKKDTSFTSYASVIQEETTNIYNFSSIYIIDNQDIANKYNETNETNKNGGGILSKNKGKKGGYKSTKQKISVIIDKKPCDRTVYKNAKGISYIRCNNEYKLLKKYKLVKNRNRS